MSTCVLHPPTLRPALPLLVTFHVLRVCVCVCVCVCGVSHTLEQDKALRWLRARCVVVLVARAPAVLALWQAGRSTADCLLLSVS
jgi:hypothetical protein